MTGAWKRASAWMLRGMANQQFVGSVSRPAPWSPPWISRRWAWGWAGRPGRRVGIATSTDDQGRTT